MTDDGFPDQPPTAAEVDAIAADLDDPEARGGELVNASFVGTGALAVAGVAGAIDPDRFSFVTVSVAILLFAVGVVAFLYGYAVGVVRSRDEKITFAGLFFLAGTAPRAIRFRMRLAFSAQIVIAVAVASIRPYTSVAFAILGPIFGLGLLSAWGAKHGTFFPRDPDDDPRHRAKSGSAVEPGDDD